MDIVTLSKCYNFAAIKHRSQRRMDVEQTPYINHPIGMWSVQPYIYSASQCAYSHTLHPGVAHILTAEAGITDPIVVQAAILHDTVEDTDTSLAEIEQHFGADVRAIVAEVTDDKSLPKAERKRLQIEHAGSSSLRAKFVKLADKVYNLRDLRRAPPVGWTPERCTEYFAWSRDVVAGLRGTNAPLERILDELFRDAGVMKK